MRYLVPALLLLVCLCSGVAQDQKRSRTPDVEISDFVAQRTSGTVNIDCRVRNSSEDSLRDVVVIFDFTDSLGRPINTRRWVLEEGEFESGDETLLLVQTPDMVRAVSITVRVMDWRERDLRVAGAGPYIIE